MFIAAANSLIKKFSKICSQTRAGGQWMHALVFFNPACRVLDVQSNDCYGRSFSPPIKLVFESRDDLQHFSRKKNALSSTKMY